MKKSLVFVILIVHLSTSIVSAQDASRSFLEQSLTSHLNAAASSPTTIVATGERTDAAGRVQPIQIWVSGKSKVRFEIGVGSGRRTTIFNTGDSWSGIGDNLKALSTHVSTGQRPVLFPFLDLIAELSNSRIQTVDRGTEVFSGRTVRRITLKLPDATPARRAFRRALDEAVELLIDTDTRLILRSERWLVSEEDMDFRAPSVGEFSDYRQVNGFWIPFRITSSIGLAESGISRSTIVLRTVTVNTPVPDRMFSPR